MGGRGGWGEGSAGVEGGVGSRVAAVVTLSGFFSFKGIAVVSKDSPTVWFASAADRVHVALQRACE